MDLRRFSALCSSIALAVCAGCGSLQEAHKLQYETVQADPRHETAVAEAEHAKALKILNEPGCCTGSNPCKAEEHLQKALVADVTYGPAHNTLGMLYLRQHRLYLAAWEFEYAQRLMSDRFEPLYNLGLVYEAADKLERAIEFYSMAFSLSPRTPDVLESLARARLRNGEPLADVRPLLKEIVFYETRPAWVCWAKDRLGLEPERFAQGDSPATPLPAKDRRTNRSQKPVPEPPVPDDSQGPPPKVALPNTTKQLSSTKNPASDVFSELTQPDSTDAPASAPLAIVSKSAESASASSAPTQGRPLGDTSSPTSRTVVPASPSNANAPGQVEFADNPKLNP
jgi:hypothetical protein